MSFSDYVLNIVSTVTLAGFSGWEQKVALLYPVAVLIIFIAARGPYDIYISLFNRKKSKINWLETLCWVTFCVFAALSYCVTNLSRDAISLVVALVGGCVVSPFGGFGIGRIINSFILTGRTVVLKGHPDSVVSMRRDGRQLSKEKALDDALFIMVYFAAHLTVAFVLCFNTADFSQALLISAAALNGSGWIIALGNAGIPGIELLSGGMKLFVALVILACRVFTVRAFLQNISLKKHHNR